MGSSDLDMLQKQLEALKKKNIERKKKGVFKFFGKKEEEVPDFVPEEKPAVEEKPVHKEHKKPKEEAPADESVLQSLDPKEKELLDNIDKLLEENA